MTTSLGIITILFGIVLIFWGDTNLNVKEGFILKAFSWPKGNAKWVKWPAGIALIYAGIKIITSQ